MIRFEDVTKRFGSRTCALSDISVKISDGEFVFLIGPSGAGKTTLLRLIIRDLVPSSGHVWVDEWDLRKIAKSQIYLLRRKVGMIFQDFKLLSERTLFENVSLALEIFGKKPPEIEKGVMDILALVGLADKRHHFPAQLSAGEMQRAGIARAIVGGPKILLADEPTGNLDPQTARSIVDILQEVNKIGTTVVMATHNAGIVNDIKKRTLLLEEGKIIHDETKGHYSVSGKIKKKS